MTTYNLKKMPCTENLKGLILAGGKSRRMGHDKSRIEFHADCSNVEYLHSLLGNLLGDVFVSVRSEQRRSSHIQDLPCIEDEFKYDSPLNGIASAMHHYPGASFLVIAVDMPNVSSQSIQTLLAHRDPNKIATCFESPVKGGPDPLFAIWEPKALPVIHENFAKNDGIKCPRGLLKSMGCHQLNQMVEPAVLANINTPVELDAYFAAKSGNV